MIEITMEEAQEIRDKVESLVVRDPEHITAMDAREQVNSLNNSWRYLCCVWTAIGLIVGFFVCYGLMYWRVL